MLLKRKYGIDKKTTSGKIRRASLFASYSKTFCSEYYNRNYHLSFAFWDFIFKQFLFLSNREDNY
jgi:hypothetical protein